jgi:hypothetical protein
MLNPFRDVNWHPDRAALRSFAISLIVGFPCIALLTLAGAYVRGRPPNVELALTIAGAGVGAGLIFLAAPIVARPFYLAWYFVACCIGLVVGNVLLALVFYVLVAGIGIVMRSAGRLSIRTGVDRSRSSYWLDVEPPPDPKRYYRQF